MLPLAVRIYVTGDGVDMAKSFDGLAALTQFALGEDPLPGHLYVFRNRPATRVKIPYRGRSGWCLFAHARARPRPRAQARPEAAPGYGRQEAMIAQAALARTEKRSRERRKPTGRKRLPADLPREELVHRPPGEEPRCPHGAEPRTSIGAERSEALDRVPASFRVLVHVREKYASANCREGVAIAPLPNRVIAAGRPSAGLLAHVPVGKFRNHLPLNRQLAIFARAGLRRGRPPALGAWL